MNTPHPRTLVLLAAAAGALALLPALAQERGAVPELPPDGSQGPAAIVFSPDGRTAYVAEQYGNQVAILDAATGKETAVIPSGGEQPTGLALSPDGRSLLVANRFSGTVAVLDLDKRAVRSTVPVPGGPSDVVIAPGGEAFVSVGQLDQVAVIDPAAARVVVRIPVGGKASAAPRSGINVPPGHRPRALALTTDGGTLLCANMSGGSLSMIDVASREERACALLPAVNLRGVAVSPDGKRAWVTGQVPNAEFTTADPGATWKNVLCEVWLNEPSNPSVRMLPLDAPSQGAADPTGIAVAGGSAYVALAGVHEVAALTEEATATRRIALGPNPTAIIVRPHSHEIWVAEHLGNAISVLSTNGGTERRIALTAPTKPDHRLRGELLFTSARLTPAGRFTCNTCHPDGNTDGLSWNFAHVHDALGLRNSRNIRGEVLLTPPYRWIPAEPDFEDFVNDEVDGIFGHRKLVHSEVHALWDLVNELPMPPNPYRAADGSLTASAQRGKVLFAGKADCATCHGGTQAGGTGKAAWIGTTAQGLKLDVPHLAGAYDSAPYLHDGRARTLEEIFAKHDPQQLHGKAHLLSPEELADLLEYVREL